MVDPLMVSIKAYDIIEKDFESMIVEGPNCICDFCNEWENGRNGKHFNCAEYEKLKTSQKFDMNKSDQDFALVINQIKVKYLFKGKGNTCSSSGN